MLLGSFSSRFFTFYLIFVGKYYSLSCEPTLGESQIFHSMVKRIIIRTRDAIKFIGDGQEQKLKKDRLIESWIKVTLLYSLSLSSSSSSSSSLSSSSSVLHSSFSANFINTSTLLRCFSIVLFRYWSLRSSCSIAYHFNKLKTLGDGFGRHSINGYTKNLSVFLFIYRRYVSLVYFPCPSEYFFSLL